MPKTKITKKKVTITLDNEIVNKLNKSKLKSSTLIIHLLYKHFSQDSIHLSQNAFRAEDLGSNPGRGAIILET